VLASFFCLAELRVEAVRISQTYRRSDGGSFLAKIIFFEKPLYNKKSVIIIAIEIEWQNKCFQLAVITPKICAI
jgi:hypothetical protein